MNNQPITFGSKTNYEEEDETCCNKCKEEVSRYKFQIELYIQKEKNHQMTLQRMGDIQKEYENHYTQLAKDYKAKEESLKQKYKTKEEVLYKEQRDLEAVYERELDQTKRENSRLQGIIDDNEREIEILKSKSERTDTGIIFQNKKLIKELENKEQRLSDLEVSIKNITEEANNQIDYLTKQNDSLQNQLNQYRMDNEEEYSLGHVNSNYLPKKNSSIADSSMEIKHLHKKRTTSEIPFICETNNNNNTHDLSINIPNHSIMSISQYDINKVKELRERIKELEEETVNLTRELSLKYEECETLHDEITKLKQTENTNNTNYFNTNQNISNCYLNEDAERNQIMELEAQLQNYGQNIFLIKESYDKIVLEHSNEINSLIQGYESKIEKLLNENNTLKSSLNHGEKIKEIVHTSQLNPSFVLNMNKFTMTSSLPKTLSTETSIKTNQDFDRTTGNNKMKIENLSEQISSIKSKIGTMN